jgi:hypothetical protein
MILSLNDQKQAILILGATVEGGSTVSIGAVDYSSILIESLPVLVTIPLDPKRVSTFESEAARYRGLRGRLS